MDEKYNFTFNFNAPVGQNIAHVDHLEAHFDKDMQMQVVDTCGKPVHERPYENDYMQVSAWLEKEKAQGRDWYEMNNRNRSAMCRQLTEEFGWVVSENSLRKAQNR